MKIASGPLLLLAFALGTSAYAAPPSPAPSPSPEPSSPFADLKFRYIGPEGNRVSAVAGVPGDSDVYYAGAASGGIFKTTDGGVHWQATFDEQPVSSIGALAVAPSDPNVVWAGTGEAFIRSNISLGWGVYRSGDAGKSWTKLGLEATGRIARIVVDPRDADVALVCALGHAYGPQPERGVFRTADGGKSWAKVLFVDERTGCSDLVMDPNNPRILFAGMWQLEIHTWGRESGGPGSGLHRSADGGLTWKPVEGNGLPDKPYGKVGLAMSKARSSRVYALIEAGDGVPWHGKQTQGGRLWRSEDGGGSWALVSSDRQLAGRTHYYNRMAVAPDDPDEAYFLTAAWAKTKDGGKTIIDPPSSSGEVPGGDHHDIWIDPGDSERMIVSHDVGISITSNRGRSWSIVQLPIAQMYHVTVDNRIPYFVYGNRQDGPSTRGPSNSKLGNPEGLPGIVRGMWSSVGGGECGWATPDPEDADIVWSSASGYGSVGGIVSRYDLRTNTARSVEVWPQATTGWPAADLKYRFNWTFPLTISPHDRERVYVGSQHVHVTTDRGQTWRELSPDLTRNDKTRQQISGGLTPDNIGVEYAGVVFAIAESRAQAGLIWAGTNDGRLHLTRDNGASWGEVTIPGLLPWGTISHVEPSRFDAGTAYVVVDGHQVNDRDPHVYKTADFGKTWKTITNGIPRGPLAYGHVLREDPVRRGLLYLGSENGLYVSFDDGALWQPLQSGLPHAPVYGLVVQEHFGDLVVGTYGRGFYILDDLTPLRRWAAGAPREAELFAPRPAYRFRGVEAPFTPFYDPVAGFNPTYGASLHYWLPTAIKGEKDKESGQQKDEIEIRIEDTAGKLVRTFKGPAKAGLNRAHWDLEFDKTTEARLRTSPRYASYIKVGPEGIPAPAVPRFALLAPPGVYSVKLKVGERELKQSVQVLRDPGTGASEADLAAQLELARDLADDLNRAVGMINAIEDARGQIAALKLRLAPDKERKDTPDTNKDVRDAAEALDETLLAFEEKLFQVRVTGRGQDLLRWPAQLAEQLGYLLNVLTAGDFAPTASQRSVHQLLHDQVGTLRTELDRLLAKDLAEFNKLLAAKELIGVVAKP